MNVLGRLALLFIVVPIVELMLLIELGQVVGLLPTFMLVMFTGVTGAWLAREEGLRVLFQFQKELASGRLPGQPMLDGIAVLIGGAFLLTPGILTDAVGFSLLFPPSRRWLQRRVQAAIERAIKDGTIRVGAVGPMSGGGFGFGGFGGEGTTAGPFGKAPSDDPAARLDPSKGIVVDPEES